MMKNIMILFTMAGAINSWAPPKEIFGVDVDRDGNATLFGSVQNEQSTTLLNIIGLSLESEFPHRLALRRAEIRAEKAEARANLAEARADFAEGKLRELAVELTSARAENKLLKEEIQSLKTDNQLLRVENLLLKGKVQSLEEQVAALNQKFDEQGAEFKAVVEKITQALASRGNANSTDEK